MCLCVFYTTVTPETVQAECVRGQSLGRCGVFRGQSFGRCGVFRGQSLGRVPWSVIGALWRVPWSVTGAVWRVPVVSHRALWRVPWSVTGALWRVPWSVTGALWRVPQTPWPGQGWARWVGRQRRVSRGDQRSNKPYKTNPLPARRPCKRGLMHSS